MNLIEKAKASKVNKTRMIITDEDIELAFCFLREEVTISQVQVAYEPKYSYSSTSAMYRMMKCMQVAYRKGMIKIAVKQ